MRTCSICGSQSHSHAWVLIAFMWPENHKSGETFGVTLCPEHTDKFREVLATYGLKVV